MDHGWKQLIEQAGDASIGSAVVRLARQAASVHRMMHARRLAEEAAGRARVVGGTDTRLHTDADLEAGVSQAERDALLEEVER